MNSISSHSELGMRPLMERVLFWRDILRADGRRALDVAH